MKYFFAEYLEPFSFVLYFVSFLLQSWKLDNHFRYKVLCGYYLIASVMMIKAYQLESNTHLYNLLYMISSLCLGYYFYTILRSRVKRFIALFYGIIALLYYVSTNAIFSNEPLFDSIGHVISSSGIVLLIFLYFHQLITNVKEELLSHNFDFWFNCSQLIYHLGAFAIFLTYNYLTKRILPSDHYSDANRDILTYLWVITSVLLFLSSLITSTGVLWIAYSRKSLSS